MSGLSRLRAAAVCALMLTVLINLPGCAPEGPAFVDANNSYDQTSITKLVESVDTTQLAGTPSAKSIDLRNEALTSLRSKGGRAVAVADLLTKTFSAETRGVPVYFERATFNGKAAVVVVEAAGPRDGNLTAKRVWVLDEQGAVLYMGSL